MSGFRNTSAEKQINQRISYHPIKDLSDLRATVRRRNSPESEEIPEYFENNETIVLPDAEKIP
ncbi:hypothetical protein L0665_08070 [Methanogenium marinum]|uniref:Uncharacterized protein n=1 Tax=Methanogenium marinum TaxID=348610 RepID=A0A9Q4PW02_9EURY|nr:hypothetical protein [Methanogenium marinum]MDE4908560.1 hypothetical protein [Methanogenium marinum]